MMRRQASRIWGADLSPQRDCQRKVWNLVVVAAALAALVNACSTFPGTDVSNALQRYEVSQPQMGIPFRIVCYAANEAHAQTAAAGAFKRIEELNAIFSDYETDSELNELSRTAGKGRAVRVSEPLWEVLERSQMLAQRTSGAFDVTIGPCVSLWRKARREKELPDPKRLAAARAAVGYQHLRLRSRDRTAELLAPGMKLDLGGIAKGYAIDAALRVLRRQGIKRALVAGGGDLALGDPPPGAKGWRVELISLDVTNAPPAEFLLLSQAAVATSGDLFQRLEIDGKRYSHIIDPRTCVGLTDHSLVTVIAPDCATADSLATAVSVLGPERGLQFLERSRGTSVRILRKIGDKIERYESPDFKRATMN